MRLTDCDVFLSECMLNALAVVVALVFLITIAAGAVLAGWHIWKLLKELR